MFGNLLTNNSIVSAIKQNQQLNYIYKNTDNLSTTYEYGDMTPTNIFPNKGIVNAYSHNSYDNNANPFVQNIPIDAYNSYGTNFTTSSILFRNEDNVLPDIISIGLKNSKSGRTIGTSQY